MKHRYGCLDAGYLSKAPSLVTFAMFSIGQNAAVQPARVAGNGFMGFDRLTSYKMITDGTSNTIALMETRLNLGPWARGGPSTLRGFDPTDLAWQSDHPPFGGHDKGMNAAMAGWVCSLHRHIDRSE